MQDICDKAPSINFTIKSAIEDQNFDRLVLLSPNLGYSLRILLRSMRQIACTEEIVPRNQVSDYENIMHQHTIKRMHIKKRRESRSLQFTVIEAKQKIR